MNMQSKRNRIARAGLMAMLAGIVAVGCTGCSAGEGLMALVRTTATGAATDVVGGIITTTIEGFVGNLNPAGEGA